MTYRLAQVNIARLLDARESERLAGFVAALDEVNASADGAPGFVWRLQTEEGNATSIKAFEFDVGDSAGVIVNLSVWESIRALSDWVFGPDHRSVLVQRRQWFERMSLATTALWWVPQGYLPSTQDAESRVLHLRQRGPTPFAFTFKESFAPPSEQ
jgi:hypothetical protein